MTRSKQTTKRRVNSLPRTFLSRTISPVGSVYLKEQYQVGTNNYPNNTIDTVAFITSFGRNNNISNNGSGRGNKDANN